MKLNKFGYCAECGEDPTMCRCELDKLRRDIRVFRELFVARVTISDLNCERALLEKDQYPETVPYCDGARDALKHLLAAFEQTFQKV